jgi:hypothetical protein
MGLPGTYEHGLQIWCAVTYQCGSGAHGNYLCEYVYAAVLLLVNTDDAVDDGYRPLIHIEHHHLAHSIQTC